MSENRGPGAEQRGVQLFGRERAFVPGLLVFGQVVHQIDEFGDIGGSGAAEERGGGHGCGILS